MRKYTFEEGLYIALIMRWLKNDYREGDERYQRTFDFTEKQEQRLWKEAKIRVDKEKEKENE